MSGKPPLQRGLPTSAQTLARWYSPTPDRARTRPARTAPAQGRGHLSGRRPRVNHAVDWSGGSGCRTVAAPISLGPGRTHNSGIHNSGI
jgi:hypothetical protein